MKVERYQLKQIIQDQEEMTISKKLIFKKRFFGLKSPQPQLENDQAYFQKCI